jgi:hypothetical protein
VLFCLLGCGDREVGRNGSKHATTPSVLSLGSLLDSTDEYKDKEVVVQGYLNTHEDGPWLSSSASTPLVNTIPLKLRTKIETSREVIQDVERIQWFSYQEPFLVEVKGLIRMESESEPKGEIAGHKLKKPRPVIEVINCKIK